MKKLKSRHKSRHSKNNVTEKALRGVTQRSIATEQLLLKGNLRKTFAMEVFIKEGVFISRSCSPVAALMPVAKLALGATGKSEVELLDVIGVESQSKLITTMHKIINNLKNASGVKLNLASKIFVNDKGVLNKNFIKKTVNLFGSSAEQVNFDDKEKAESIINEWIKNEIDGLTSAPYELLVSPGQTMVVINIVTFFGSWGKKFEKVEAGEFKSPEGVIKVPMMTRQSIYNYYKCNVLQAELIEIPYQTKKVSFLIVLPFSEIGLGVLIKQLKLAPGLLNNSIKAMRQTAIILTMPKFKLYDKLDLKPIYKMVGLNHMFSQKTGLTGILDDEELTINTAWQLTLIDVNEDGTSGSEGTDAEKDPISAIKKKVAFNAAHPFLFFVMSEGEQILAGTFSGNTHSLEASIPLET